MAYLTIENPDSGESRYMLAKKKILIGRGDDVDIVVEAEWVSGEHACIEYDGGHYHIEDLGSSNGTFINYKRIGGSQKLKDNDLIFLGRTKILFRNDVAELEESSVELDILNDDQSGVFTAPPQPTQLTALRSTIEDTSKKTVKDILKNNVDTQERISIEEFVSSEIKETSKEDIEAALRESNMKVASLEMELEQQRQRAEEEINQLLKELTTWKSRYFDAVDELKSLKQVASTESGSESGSDSAGASEQVEPAE